jgi:hypothetical protein
MGDYNFDDVQHLAHVIMDECRKRKCKRVLVDITHVEGEVPDADKFYIGRVSVEVLAGIKIAVVTKKEHINYFYRDTAVNRGKNVEVFPEHEAVAWLTGKDSASNKYIKSWAALARGAKKRVTTWA